MLPSYTTLEHDRIRKSDELIHFVHTRFFAEAALITWPCSTRWLSLPTKVCLSFLCPDCVLHYVARYHTFVPTAVQFMYLRAKFTPLSDSLLLFTNHCHHRSHTSHLNHNFAKFESAERAIPIVNIKIVPASFRTISFWYIDQLPQIHETRRTQNNFLQTN